MVHSGDSMGCHDAFMMLSWNVHGLLRRFQGAFMVLLRDFHGTFMGLSWGFHGAFMGFHWASRDINGGKWTLMLL